MLAQIPMCGAELGGTALLLPLPWVEELKAKKPLLRGLEGCPNFHSSKLKTHQLGKAARRLGELCLPEARHALGAALGSQRWPFPAL